ncbi:hypothetical protein [Providencia alcalifaciens]|uniref:hypothetical protein n=1 Tax=Providencia alcalifaciens TaxID=126385 RepID=UPI0003E2C19A|nr:hypothetical protein [Providencia alcalifaciens]ETT01552.1 hypothetical protein HMPREF1568_1380 [Providencia alcalifaciens PAL-3]EUC99677.1 hypothetical protein HMPREF1566_3516 [Providencia alcalifaciens PAL-1]
MRIFQTKLQDSILMNYSLSDMVREIVKNPTVFEGRKYIIINEIKKVNNNSSGGGKEISEAWDIAKKNGCKEAQRKTNKYFMEGTKASENYFLKPTEQPLSTQEIKIEKRKNILDKEVARKACDDDFSNHSIKKTTPIEGDAKNDVTIEKMGPCEGVIDKPKNEVVGEKANSFTRGFSIIKNKLNHQNSSKNEPKFQKILPSHTIEEAIEIKVIFNRISDRSLNLIKSKIKAKFNELKLSETPELFEREMFNAQGVLKKYDNELVCGKINNIINKYLDKHEVYIRENKSPISRIWYAIHSVSLLQGIRPRKFNEFKMAIIDYLKEVPIEDIKEYSSKLKKEISNYTHKNIADQVNDFITAYFGDRVNELKGYEKISIESKPDLLQPKENIDTEELMKSLSLKKIISHVFKRVINNVRRFFSRN